MKYIIFLTLVLSGCSTTNRHSRPRDSFDREVAMGSYAIGGLIGFAGCVAGFVAANGNNEKATKILVPVCIGGWAFGMGGMTYLGLDDYLRGKSYERAIKP